MYSNCKQPFIKDDIKNINIQIFFFLNSLFISHFTAEEIVKSWGLSDKSRNSKAQDILFKSFTEG